jgi:RNA polymerase sigma factor (sigma-70 family)
MEIEAADSRARGAEFERQRGRLWGVAYRMLASAAEAEDMVQEAYLRWHGAAVDDVRTPQAWLVTTVTRLCIDRLRQLRAERAAYVGPWLPEPLVAEAAPADELTELASDLSVAFLAVLERLAPEERAAFLLHDVFDADYGEIAGVLKRAGSALALHKIAVNGETGLAMLLKGRLIAVLSVRTDVERFVAFYSILNPVKLRGVTVGRRPH